MFKLNIEYWFIEKNITPNKLKVSYECFEYFKNKPVYDVAIEKETEKAVLVKFLNNANTELNNKTLWLPKSVINLTEILN